MRAFLTIWSILFAGKTSTAFRPPIMPPGLLGAVWDCLLWTAGLRK